MSDLAAATQTAKPAQRFFFWMALLLLVLNVVGFSPTFFLRRVFDGPALAPRTIVHGVLFTAWFVLFFVQAGLVEARRIRAHRRLGTAGAVLAALMVVSGLIILYFGVLDFRDSGGDVARASQFLWGNLTLLAAFAVFVALGVRNRRRPPAHKRLMLLASLAMMGQALSRMGTFPPLQIGSSAQVSEAVYGLGGLALLLCAVIVHDVLVRGRPHPTVAWGAPALLGSILIAGLVLPFTSLGQSIVALIY